MLIKNIVFISVVMLSLKSFECSHSEKTLVRKLLRDYEPLARPVNDSSKPVTLSIIVTLRQIVDLDERNQILKTNIWLEYYWTDTNLIWNTTENNGIKDIRIPPSKIWKPDVLLYNSASQEFDTTYEVNVNVNHEGLCKYGPPAIFESTCKIDIRMFPFDTQNCTLKFGSWTYHNKSIDLIIKSNHFEEWKGSDSHLTQTFEDWYSNVYGYEKSGEWQLEGFPALRENPMYEYDGRKEWYPSITYTIMIRRRTLYYWSNLILPCVIIASLTVLGFYYPPEAGEKVSLEITILMALTFFMQVVSDMQPPSSQIPIISTYFTSIMVMVAASVFCTILVLNYHHRLASNGAMPAMIQKVFLQWLPWLLRMSRNGEKITRRSIELQNKMEALKKMDNSSKSLMANILEKNDDYILPASLQEIPSFNYASSLYRSTGFINELNFNNCASDCPKQMYCDVKECNQDTMNANIGSIHDLHPNPTTKQPDYFLPYMKHTAILKKELESIIQEIQFITDKYRDEAEEASLEDDWKYAAMVFDRFCLYSFTIFTGVLSAAVFLIPDRVIVY